MGHIFFVAPSSNDLLDELARWTVQWILGNEVSSISSTVYACESLEEAEASISIPLAHGEPPALIVIDHGASNQRITAFGEKIRACVPESWVVELVEADSWLPSDLAHAFLVKKPIQREDWENLLQHILLHSATPQWSRGLLGSE